MECFIKAPAIGPNQSLLQVGVKRRVGERTFLPVARKSGAFTGCLSSSCCPLHGAWRAQPEHLAQPATVREKPLELPRRGEDAAPSAELLGLSHQRVWRHFLFAWVCARCGPVAASAERLILSTSPRRWHNTSWLPETVIPAALEKCNTASLYLFN